MQVPEQLNNLLRSHLPLYFLKRFCGGGELAAARPCCMPVAGTAMAVPGFIGVLFAASQGA